MALSVEAIVGIIGVITVLPQTILSIWMFVKWMRNKGMAFPSPPPVSSGGKLC